MGLQVPGLYKPEEIDPLLVSIKEMASDEGWRGSMFGYFVKRIQQNLHVALILDSSSSEFTFNLESNPVRIDVCLTL
jgi:dynein heavy chain 2, cytosolic